MTPLSSNVSPIPAVAEASGGQLPGLLLESA